MATRTAAGAWQQVAAVVFTSVVAPVLVTVINQGLQGPNVSHASEPAQVAEERDILISHGRGNTPDAARQDALRSALLRAVETVLPADADAKDRTAACDRILREPEGVVTRFECLKCAPDGAGHRAEITAEVLRPALQSRLRGTAVAQAP